MRFPDHRLPFLPFAARHLFLRDGVGRPSSGAPRAIASPSTDLVVPGKFLNTAHDRILFVRHLFEFKIFAERYLANPVAPRRFSGNRSVLVAQIAACVLVLLLGIGSIRAWHRLSSLQTTRINPVLQSLSTSLDGIAVSSGATVSPAVDLFNSLGAARQNEYYSLAFPASYLDLNGVHRNLRETLERTFEIVVLRSCKYALESRVSVLLNSRADRSQRRGLSRLPLGNCVDYRSRLPRSGTVILPRCGPCRPISRDID